MDTTPTWPDGRPHDERQPEPQPFWRTANLPVPLPRNATKAVTHYRGIAPAGLAVYIPFGDVHGENLWALVIVIAILVVADIAVTWRRAAPA
ncbi:hypothetical protein ACFVT6_38350 [Streptomyces sp. NPDC058049]|uniref:hypothetical protein n=1 Tax=Streptomyces sp. NPDC058049 TaxID=3346314 RepID=UPI0036E98ADA